MSPIRSTVAAACFLSFAVACSFDGSTRWAGEVPGSSDGAVSPMVDASVTPDAPRTPPDASLPDAAPPQSLPGHLLSFAHDDADAIALDGIADGAWTDQTFIGFDIDDAAQYEAIGSYVSDASVSFASVHDDDRIYFFIRVVDDVLVDNSVDIYHDDAVELYIDGANDASGTYNDDDHWLVLGANGDYRSFGPDNIAIAGFVRTTADGYDMEIALDKDDLGITPGSTSMGFNIALVDDDNGFPSNLDAYGLWWTPPQTSCPSCCGTLDEHYAFCDTTMLGELVLMP